RRSWADGGRRAADRRGPAREELPRLDPHGGAVRAGVHAARLLELRAQVAAGRLQPDDRFLPGLAFSLDLERVHVDVAVRTLLGPAPAPDAPVLDDDLQGPLAADGPDRAADHAQRIAAGAAGRGDQVLVVPEPVADEPRHAVVGLGARPDAGVASDAALQ